MPVVVLGTDALLAAAPYTAVQLAHACLQAGYASVVPASWGDELVAAAVLRRLPSFGHCPAIQCSCPIVAHRLLTTGGDLRPVMLPLVSPPVALARYVRAVSHPTRVRITYVGGCPGAVDASIDIRMSPETLIGMLAERDIVLDEQPRVFESIIPPDRRRYFSQPGGVPSAERLWSDLGSRALVDVESDDFVSEIADHLLAGEHVLMDVAPRLGCVCSGAVSGTPAREARASVVALEPPRSSAPVVEEQAPLDLDLPIPAVPRNPVDVALATRTPSSPLALPSPSTPPMGQRATPTVTEPRTPRQPTPPAPRPISGSVPTARHADGKALPRAYVARRRQSAPKGNPVVPPNPSSDASTNTSSEALPAASDELLIEPTASLPSHEVAAAATAGAETSTEKEPETLPTGSAHTHAADDVSTETGPTSPAGDGHVGGGEESSAAADETTTPAVDIDQLQLEGLAPSILERLPIFTPNGAGAQVDQPIPASGVVSGVSPRSRRQSRIVMYVVAAALALFVVAGVAYFAGRSAQASNTPTGQLP
ncbi:MAG TPA: hypothetical protein VGH04_06280 [Gemmatimonadaceae bacterium]